ncbi:hypothetical protein WN51_14131 [Melipona quadrifasciata]|uniref:Uncharacterized protein n=1 Tax=Melipona quadrifasciata TaxID=166423 RepID=A0A0N0U5F6_9HYME|nr:hypothetical protein WN51_14131 [Melipona quadrifasciata]
MNTNFYQSSTFLIQEKRCLGYFLLYFHSLNISPRLTFEIHFYKQKCSINFPDVKMLQLPYKCNNLKSGFCTLYNSPILQRTRELILAPILCKYLSDVLIILFSPQAVKYLTKIDTTKIYIINHSTYRRMKYPGIGIKIRGCGFLRILFLGNLKLRECEQSTYQFRLQRDLTGIFQMEPQWRPDGGYRSVGIMVKVEIDSSWEKCLGSVTYFGDEVWKTKLKDNFSKLIQKTRSRTNLW